MRFLFKLRDVASIRPWGTTPDLSLSWFGLTDGAYCIETAAGRLLEYVGPPDEQLGVPWCDYQVVRLFEDLIDILPQVLEPVPDDIVARFSQWQSDPTSQDAPEDDRLAEAWFDAQMWWGWRQLDFGYLTACPQLHFWRSGANIHGQWRVRDGTASGLTVSHADIVVPTDVFHDAAQTFFRMLLSGMRERVGRIAREGWTGHPCDVDIPGLVAEQRDREREPSNRQIKRPDDWDVVRRNLALLGA